MSGFGSFVGGLFSGANSMTGLMKAANDLKLEDMQMQGMQKAIALGQQQQQPTGTVTAVPTGSDQTPPPPDTSTTDTSSTSGGGGGRGTLAYQAADYLTDTSSTSGGAGGWGPLAYQAADYFKSQGYSDAAIQGILANGLAEGGFNQPWAPSGIKGENSFGPWQFNDRGELPNYLNWAQQNNVSDPHQFAPQMQYLDNWVKTNMPDYKNIQDPKAATDQWLSKFERPAAQYNYPGARYSQLATVQHYLSSGESGSRAAPPTPAQTALATSNAPPANTIEGNPVTQAVPTQTAAATPAPNAPAPGTYYTPTSPQPASPAQTQPPPPPAAPIPPPPAGTAAAPAPPQPVPTPTPQPAAALAPPASSVGRNRTTNLVEGGKTYPPGVMSPSELEAWHNRNNPAQPQGTPPPVALQPNQPRAAPAAYVTPPNQAAPRFWNPYGDSIAAGVINVGGAPGSTGQNPAVDTTQNATPSRTSKQVLDRVNAIPDGSLNGAPIMLSSGASNDIGTRAGGTLTGGQLDNIDRQIKSLKRAGAGDIMLMGVGSKAGREGGQYYDMRNINPQLAKIAADNNVRFTGPLPTVVHPGPDYYRSAARYSPAQGSAI